MSRARSLALVFVAVAATGWPSSGAWAGPPGHTGRWSGRVSHPPLVVPPVVPGSSAMVPPPVVSGPRIFFGFGIGNFGALDYSGYGTGLYSPSGYGLGFSPFGYSGLPYGGVGYGALGYGFGYPSQALGVTIPKYRTVPPAAQSRPPSEPQSRPPIEPQYWENTELLKKYAPQPLPLPLPTPGSDTRDAKPATITVLAREGSQVTFNDQPGQSNGEQHTFTTAAIAPGTEQQVHIQVDHPRGATTMTLKIRAGDKITVDLRP